MDTRVPLPPNASMTCNRTTLLFFLLYIYRRLGKLIEEQKNNEYNHTFEIASEYLYNYQNMKGYADAEVWSTG
jgi:hypothetical protein